MYPPGLTAESFFQLLHSLGAEAFDGTAEVAGAQLAVPSPFEFETGISRMKHKLPCLYGVDLRGGLATRFGWQPDQVQFLRDAAAFLLGEIAAGAARGASRAVGITLGTGIGSGFAVSGRVVTQGFGIPPGGEVWNLPFEGETVEDFLSARAIQHEYERRTGMSREVADLAAAAADDAVARETFTVFGKHLGQALRATLSDFAPDVVVLGGGISHAAPLFLPSTRRELDGLGLRLETSSMIDGAALVGAAAAWFNEGRARDDPKPESLSAATQRDG